MNADTDRSERVETCCKRLLDALAGEYGLRTEDANFADTPKRMAKYFHEMLDGTAEGLLDAKLKALLGVTFPCQSDEMVLVSGIRTIGLCPHHMLPVDYKVAAAYVPSKRGGHVIGLSKIPRIVQALASRPVLQETLVGEVADALTRIEGCAGSACYAVGRHYCMLMRGVKERGAVTTASAVRGVFAANPSARAEFLDLARKEA